MLAMKAVLTGLCDDHGVSASEYLLVEQMLPSRIRACVRATDGRFYAPKGIDVDYLLAQVVADAFGWAIEEDNEGQQVLYTGGYSRERH